MSTAHDGTTHWPDCWADGPKHYECCKVECVRLKTELENAQDTAKMLGGMFEAMQARAEKAEAELENATEEYWRLRKLCEPHPQFKNFLRELKP